MTARAQSALYGLALGDALGMPTQSMSREEIASTYGTVTTLVDAADSQPIAPGMPAGRITDDTEQALLVADLVIAGGGLIDPHDLATTLLSWEEKMIAAGSRDLLGPSTKAALDAVRHGADPATTGTTGTTNGGAMRVAPVGIAYRPDDEEFPEAVYRSVQVTHDTTHGFESALLIASAVSFGIEGAGTQEAILSALDYVSQAEPRGCWSPKASVLERAKFAVACIGNAPDQLHFLTSMIGTSVEANESVPCALAIAYICADQPTEALYAAANIGGDTDTIAAMAGAILGASGADFDSEALRHVRTVNDLDIENRVAQLTDVR